ncbi:MAG: peroxiredoxin [Psychrobium sp.]
MKIETMPNGQLTQRLNGETVTHNAIELFANKKIALFAVPGAFTPTCSASHLPGFVALADKIKAKGIDAIVCVSVNDAFVMEAWGQAHNAEEIMMLGDGDGSYTKALGLDKETGSFGGIRSQRYSMIVDNGVVTNLNIEQKKEFKISDAETLLGQI